MRSTAARGLPSTQVEPKSDEIVNMEMGEENVPGCPSCKVGLRYPIGSAGTLPVCDIGGSESSRPEIWVTKQLNLKGRSL